MIKIVVAISNNSFQFGQSAKDIVSSPADWSITWGAAWKNIRLVGCSVHANIEVTGVPVPLQTLSVHTYATSATSAVPAPTPNSVGSSLSAQPTEIKIFTAGYNNPSKPMLCVDGVTFQAIYCYPLRTSTSTLNGDVKGYIELDFLGSEQEVMKEELLLGKAFKLISIS